MPPSSPPPAAASSAELLPLLARPASGPAAVAAVVVAIITASPSPVAADPSAHHWLFAVVSTAEHANEATADDVSQLAGDVSDYWATQSRGEISAFEMRGVEHYTSSLGCDGDLEGEAARRFGFASSAELVRANPATHLVVVTPAGCESGARGSIGSSVHAGGVVVMGHSEDAAAILAHEIGHNLSLEHANARFCHADDDAVADCETREYADSWDVMGVTTLDMAAPALNAAMAARLGFGEPVPEHALDPGQPASVETATLDTVASVEGRSSVRVVDPRTAEAYYVEYRAGESGTRYETGGSADHDLGQLELGPGVRIVREDGSGSEVIATQGQPGGSFIATAESVGDTVATPSGSVTVTVNRIEAGTVDLSIALDDGTGRAPVPPAAPEPAPEPAPPAVPAPGVEPTPAAEPPTATDPRGIDRGPERSTEGGGGDEPDHARGPDATAPDADDPDVLAILVGGFVLLTALGLTAIGVTALLGRLRPSAERDAAGPSGRLSRSRGRTPTPRWQRRSRGRDRARRSAR